MGKREHTNGLCSFYCALLPQLSPLSPFWRPVSHNYSPFGIYTPSKIWHSREVPQQELGRKTVSRSYWYTQPLCPWWPLTYIHTFREDNSRSSGAFAWTPGSEENIISTPNPPHFHYCEGGWLHNLDFKCHQGSDFYGIREKMLQLLLVLTHDERLWQMETA